MCASCSKNKRTFINQRNNIQRSSNNSNTRTLENTNFLELYYIRNSTEEIPSVIPNVSYGIKEYGTLMYVAEEDYNLHPDWWSSGNPNIINPE